MSLTVWFCSGQGHDENGLLLPISWSFLHSHVVFDKISLLKQRLSIFNGWISSFCCLCCYQYVHRVLRFRVTSYCTWRGQEFYSDGTITSSTCVGHRLEPFMWVSGSLTKNFLCITHAVEHNYISPISTVGIQVHVSAVYVGHLHVVI